MAVVVVWCYRTKTEPTELPTTLKWISGSDIEECSPRNRRLSGITINELVQLGEQQFLH